MHATDSIAPLLKAIEEACSAPALVEAVEALAQANSEAAVPALIAALGYNNPGAAVAAVEGLIRLGTVAVSPLLTLLDNFNYGARAWAIRALAGIGDPRGLEILLEAAANDFALSVRRAAARGLGTIQWEQMPPEERPEAQQQGLTVLLQAAQDPEWVVRYAAIAGIQSLAPALYQTQPLCLQPLAQQLEQLRSQESTLAVVARIRVAQRAIAQLCS